MLLDHGCQLALEVGTFTVAWDGARTRGLKNRRPREARTMAGRSSSTQQVMPCVHRFHVTINTEMKQILSIPTFLLPELHKKEN